MVRFGVVLLLLACAVGKPGDCGPGCDADSGGDAPDDTGCPLVASWVDADGDGWGDDARPTDACAIPEGSVGRGGDCDDTDDTVFPGAVERCGGEDDDCDGLVDEADPDLDVALMEIVYVDGDGDGWGGEETRACSAGEGLAATGGDCDDGDAAVHPGADEVCDNGVDDDCDGDGEPCRWSAGSLATADASLVGEAPDEQLGALLALLDVDDDGAVDLLLPSPSADVYRGRVRVVPPGWEGEGVPVGDVATADVVGPTGGEGWLFGAAVAGGDLDGDGVADLAVGGWRADVGDAEAGAVWVLPGPVQGEVSADDGAVLSGPFDNAWAGSTLAWAADATGDGLPDLWVGAVRGGPGEEGAVYLQAGPLTGDASLAASAAQWHGEARGDDVAGALATGDLDGDGLDDLLVGVPVADGFAGRVYGVLGPAGGIASLADADLRVDPDLPGGRLGAALSAADLDGDGVVDLAVGAPGDSTAAAYAGALRILPGPLVGERSAAEAVATLTGSLASDGVGAAFALGDLDGDGVRDAFLGVPGRRATEADDGAACLLPGPLLGVRSVGEGACQGAERAASFAGAAVALPGDVDGDGWADALVGAPGLQTGDSARGGVYLLLGGGP